MGKHVRYRRIYDDVSPEDGRRILVDRIWPQGVRMEDARLDEWLRDVAPSTELRRWYGHDPERYEEFRPQLVGTLATKYSRCHWCGDYARIQRKESLRVTLP
jgi:uncharacterized protein YeaO (DUF488 family)